jgi:hypothetical protein
MVDTIWGTTKKPVASKKLAECFERSEAVDGTLYIGYPILGTPSGAFPFDAILLSPQHGVVIFDVVEGTNIGDYVERQDGFFTKLQSKLIQYPALVRRRSLRAKLTTVTFAPAVRVQQETNHEEYPVFGRDDGLIDFINDVHWDDTQLFPDLASAISIDNPKGKEASGYCSLELTWRQASQS